MLSQPQVKQALKQLPPAERVVAIALKNIYDQVRKLFEKESLQAQNIRFQFTKRYKDIENNMASIINGRIINQNELTKPDYYFVEEQKNQLKQVLQSKAPIKDYWHNAIKNSFLKMYATDQDWKILAHLTNISQNISQTQMQLTFTFQTNSYLKAGSYKRTMQLQNGLPTNFQGDQLQSLKQPLTQGFIFSLFQNTTDQQQLYKKLEVITFIINELIPYSLNYFLGQVHEQFQDEQEQNSGQNVEDQEGGDDDQGESQKHGQKGRKKN